MSVSFPFFECSYKTNRILDVEKSKDITWDHEHKTSNILNQIYR